MNLFGGYPAYWFLSNFFQKNRNAAKSRASHLPDYQTRLIKVMGETDWQTYKEQSIVDFGCGYGEGVVELATNGAKSVVGIDIRSSVLEHASELAERAGVSDRCRFVTKLPAQSAAIIISIDAFEHFSDPAAALKTMAELLVADGQIIVSFGPTWYHPRGGHIFSAFPWAHLLFSESSLCRWRRDFRDDRATRFCEVEGGLNQMTIAQFERLVNESPLRFQRFLARPIRSLRWLHRRCTREFLTSVVDCVLVKKG